MKISIKRANGEEILYSESFFLGKKTLQINGEYAIKVSRNEFYTEKNGVRTTYFIKGNYYLGVTVVVNEGEKDEELLVLSKTTAGDAVLIFLPLVGVIFGVIFGATESAIAAVISGCVFLVFCAFAAFINAIILKAKLKKGLKIFLCILNTLIWIGIATLAYVFIVVLLIVSAFEKL